jgi:lysophospholipase L1-like esterase
MLVRLRTWLVVGLAVAAGTGSALVGVASDPGVATAATPTYYLALGDSLAANVGASPSSNGYVNRIYQHELTRSPGLVLDNISCSGATTASMLTGSNCGRPVTQIVDAENFLHAHPGQVAFVTIDIGGNDASGCVSASGVDATCSANAAAAIQANLTSILARLKAAYPGVRVYGMNYYTPPLAYWLTGASGQQVARDSVPAAKAFNDQLEQIYAAAGFATADVSAAFDNDNLALTGSYGGLTVPQNVANLCNWTLVCSNNNVHANNTGHGKLADAFTSLIDQAPATAPLAIDTAALAPGTIGVPYVGILTASGGTAPYHWKKIGKLPKGLHLTPRSGWITGTPKKLAGTFTLQIQVRDKAKPKATTTSTFSIVITGAT